MTKDERFSRVGRMNITLPPGLREEMDEATERVNWSKVASDAFRAKLDELRRLRSLSVSNRDCRP